MVRVGDDKQIKVMLVFLSRPLDGLLIACVKIHFSQPYPLWIASLQILRLFSNSSGVQVQQVQGDLFHGNERSSAH